VVAPIREGVQEIQHLPGGVVVQPPVRLAIRRQLLQAVEHLLDHTVFFLQDLGRLHCRNLQAMSEKHSAPPQVP
jgi:hypothetical protein